METEITPPAVTGFLRTEMGALVRFSVKVGSIEEKFITHVEKAVADMMNDENLCQHALEKTAGRIEDWVKSVTSKQFTVKPVEEAVAAVEPVEVEEEPVVDTTPITDVVEGKQELSTFLSNDDEKPQPTQEPEEAPATVEPVAPAPSLWDRIFKRK